MWTILLNLAPSEPFSLVKKFPYFNKSIDLYVLLVGVLHIGVHDPVNCRILNVVMVEFCMG